MDKRVVYITPRAFYSMDLNELKALSMLPVKRQLSLKEPIRFFIVKFLVIIKELAYLR